MPSTEMWRIRAEAAERRLAAFNTNGFSDADVLAEKFLELTAALAKREEELREARNAMRLALDDLGRHRIHSSHEIRCRLVDSAEAHILGFVGEKDAKEPS